MNFFESPRNRVRMCRFTHIVLQPNNKKNRSMSFFRLSKLRSLLAEFEGYRFFSASILIAFDAEAADSSSDDAVKVCIIDFAHSTFSGFFEVCTETNSVSEFLFRILHILVPTKDAFLVLIVLLKLWNLLFR